MKLLSETELLSDVITEHNHSLLYFSAAWCGPCKSMAPVVEQVSQKLGNRINAIKIDVDNHANTAAEYGIRSIPTVILTNKSQVLTQEVGGMSASELTQILEKHL